MNYPRAAIPALLALAALLMIVTCSVSAQGVFPLGEAGDSTLMVDKAAVLERASTSFKQRIETMRQALTEDGVDDPVALLATLEVGLTRT